MSTEHDAYGMTAEERAAFDAHFFRQYQQSTKVFNPTADAHARTWATCAKLCREQMKKQRQAVRAFEDTFRITAMERAASGLRDQIETRNREVKGVHAANSALTDEVEKLQIGNDALLARIKDLEAELADARAELRDALDRRGE
jgi:septal ring factor EnvC (AmiA/AmiB activator)